MVNLKIPGLCFCDFNLKPISKKKTYPSFNHTFQQTAFKIKPVINSSQTFSYINQVNGFQGVSTTFQDNSNVLLSHEVSTPQIHSMETDDLYKESRRNNYFKNLSSSEYKRILMDMNLSQNQNLFENKKPPINRNLSENFSTKKKRERSRRYSVSDHISQMSTWQNSLISEFGMLPTLPCIPYFSVLDDSDEYSDISCNESVISVHNLDTGTFNNNVSHLIFQSTNTADIRPSMSSFSNTGLHKNLVLMSDDSKHFEVIDSSKNMSTFSNAIVSSKYNNTKSLKTEASKRKFKFKFPRIKFSLKYDKSFTKVIIPVRCNSEKLSRFRAASHLPEHINLNSIQNLHSNIKQSSVSAFEKNKIGHGFLFAYDIKRNKVNVKNYNFFRKFILKIYPRKTKIFRSKGTQTYISMFNDFLSKDSQELKGFSQDIFYQKKDINSFKDANVYHKLEVMRSIQETNYVSTEKQSLVSRYSISEPYQKFQTNENILSNVNISEYDLSPKQSRCFCTCTCLCGACCGSSKTEQPFKRRPSSVVFVEIAASRKAEKYSNTTDFNEDLDDEIITAVNKTCASDNFSLDINQLGTNLSSLKLIDDNNFKPKLSNRNDYDSGIILNNTH
ncbi:hypothetical protein PORY_002473 [Pneumocystis oryctolagi]|uniref:Uncharacterized protein n=1 Tax=Pneumocystis oryctolagi TaxID=42067 RepID=A0ACB7CBB4_9ASCO|nr:hypothetical protein PORY_002473 [Pneumocystis oryctolagi]